MGDQDASQPQKLDMTNAIPLSASPKLDMTNAVPLTPAAAARQGATGVSGVLSGIGGGIFDTVQGAKNIVNDATSYANKKTGMQIPQISDVPADLRTQNSPSEKFGGFLENVGEFAAGDAALAGVLKFAKTPEAVLQLIEKYPTAAKLIANTTKAAAKGAAVGGVQGAVKGAAEGNVAGGAEGGALGGAIGGGAGEVVGGAVGKLAEKANPVDALTRAVRPTGRLAIGFGDKAALALPRLVAEHAQTPIETLGDLSDAAHEAAKKVWDNEIVPQISKHAEEIIDGKPIADKIRGSVLPGTRDLDPAKAEIADLYAQKFDGSMTLQQASDRLRHLNDELHELYSMSPMDRYHVSATKPSLDAMENAANELRGQIYTKLEQVGEVDPKKLRQTYGALKTIEQTADKRAIVHDRQSPINLGQTLGAAMGVTKAAGSLLAGNPAGAVAGIAPVAAAKISKAMNSPEHLIGEALKPAGPVRKAVQAVAAGTGAAGANVGSQVGQGTASDLKNPGPSSQLPPPVNGVIRAQLVDGSIQDIHEGDFSAFQRMHPDLHVIHS